MRHVVEFDHITIKPIVRKRKYVAEFNVTLPIKSEVTIGGNSPEECLTKTENFLKTKLTEDQYTILP